MISSTVVLGKKIEFLAIFFQKKEWIHTSDISIVNLIGVGGIVWLIRNASLFWAFYLNITLWKLRSDTVIIVSDILTSSYFSLIDISPNR